MATRTIERKLWKITSYDDYINNYVSTCGEIKTISNYMKNKLGYRDLEHFFNVQAIHIQSIANDRVMGLLDTEDLPTEDLPDRVIKCLQDYTYRAIDHLRYSDKIIAQNVRLTTTIDNNGRVVSSTQAPTTYWEQIVGTYALNAWITSGLEKLVRSYCADQGVVYILDDKKFYNKDQINHKFDEVYDRIDLERDYVNNEIERVDDKIDTGLALKQNIADQKLYQQDINGAGEPELLGQFDEILIQSQNPQNAVVDLPSGKKRALIKFDTSQIVDASVFNTADQNDTTNAIGRVWGYNQEQKNNLQDTEIGSIKNDITNNVKKKLYPIDRMIHNPFKENTDDKYQFQIMSVYYDGSQGGFVLPREIKYGEQYIIGTQSKPDLGKNVIVMPLATVGAQQRFTRATMFGGGDNGDLYIKVFVNKNILTVSRVEYTADSDGNVKRTERNVSATYNVVVFYREYNNEYSPDITIENVVQQHIPILLNAGRNWPYNESKLFFSEMRKSSSPNLNYVTEEQLEPVKQTVDFLKPIVDDLKMKDDKRVEILKKVDTANILKKVKEELK